MNNPLRYTDPSGLYIRAYTDAELGYIYTVNSLRKQGGWTDTMINNWMELADFEYLVPNSHDACEKARKGILAADSALSRRGAEYRLGGNGDDLITNTRDDPRGYVEGPNRIPEWDCSGLVKASWGNVGVGIEKRTFEQYDTTIEVDPKDRRPGDLIFYYPTKDGPAHVTMYIGDGMMVESPSEGGYVHTEAVRSNGWVGYGRPDY